MKNYYSKLGLENYASVKEVKKAIQERIKVADKEELKDLIKAIDLLNYAAKKKYDEQLEISLIELEGLKKVQENLKEQIEKKNLSIETMNKELESLKKKQEENEQQLKEIEEEKDSSQEETSKIENEEKTEEVKNEEKTEEVNNIEDNNDDIKELDEIKESNNIEDDNDDDIKELDDEGKEELKVSDGKKKKIVKTIFARIAAAATVVLLVVGIKSCTSKGTEKTDTSVEVIENNYGTAENIYDKIENVRKKNSNYAPSITCVEDVEELIARIEDNNYEGYLTYTDYYMLMKELMEEKLDVSELFYNTSYYENINKLDKALIAMDTTNDTLKDEYTALMAVQETVDNSTNQYAEVTGYLSLTDYYIKETGTSIPTACGIVEGGSMYNNVADASYRSGDNSYQTLQNTLTKEEQAACMKAYKLIDPDSDSFAWVDEFDAINEIDNAKVR